MSAGAPGSTPGWVIDRLLCFPLLFFPVVNLTQKIRHKSRLRRDESRPIGERLTPALPSVIKIKVSRSPRFDSGLGHVSVRFNFFFSLLNEFNTSMQHQARFRREGRRPSSEQITPALPSLAPLHSKLKPAGAPVRLRAGSSIGKVVSFLPC